MMNNVIKLILLGILIVVFTCTCKQDNPSTTEDQLSDSTEIFNESPEEDTLSINNFVTPPRDMEEMEIIDDQIKNSPFYELGCCTNKEERKKTCCCKEVVNKYREIRAQDNLELILKVKTEDPIFTACKSRKKWRALIEELDNPPANENIEIEDEFDH